MERPFFTLLLLFLCSLGKNISAQNYIPFPDSNATWNVLYSRYCPNVPPYNACYEDWIIEQLGDTTIGNLQYHKIFQNFNYVGAIREDSAKQILFFGDYYNKGISEESVLYQFGYKEGDTVHINSQYRPYNVIGGIDSVLIRGQYRKRYYLQGDTWIEGIGSTHFLFMPFDKEFERTWQLLCFKENDTLIYESII